MGSWLTISRPIKGTEINTHSEVLVGESSAGESAGEAISTEE